MSITAKTCKATAGLMVRKSTPAAIRTWGIFLLWMIALSSAHAGTNVAGTVNATNQASSVSDWDRFLKSARAAMA
jgi:hypothetical protein